MNASTLPPRPWRLDRAALKRERRKRWALALFLPLFGGAFVAYGGSVAVELVRERALWADGREGQILSLDHTIKEERWPLVPLTVFEYELSTRYLDSEGKLHEATSKLSRFGRLDPLRWTLKYDPQAPERIVFSGGMDSSAPWLGVLAALVFGLPLMAVGPHGLRAARRRHADVEAVALDGEERRFDLLSAAGVNGEYVVAYRDARGKKAQYTLSGPPRIVTEQGRDRVVALVSPRGEGRPVLLARDLRPFLVEEAGWPQVTSTRASSSR